LAEFGELTVNGEIAVEFRPDRMNLVALQQEGWTETRAKHRHTAGRLFGYTIDAFFVLSALCSASSLASMKARLLDVARLRLGGWISGR